MKLDYIHSANIEIPSANAIQVTHMSQAFARTGASVTLWYPRYRCSQAIAGWRRHYGVGDGFVARAVPTVLSERLFASPALPLLKSIGYLNMLARWRAGQPPDAIYTRCFAAAAVLPRALGRLFGRRRPRVVFEAHEFPPSPARAAALRGVDGVVAITSAAAVEISGKLRISPQRMLVAPDGVDGAWLDAPISRADARKRMALDPGRRLAVYTGRFHPGTSELLHGVATRLGGRVDILAVGPGATEARSRVLPAPGLSILDPVPIDDARSYQAAADVLLMPHTGEVRWARYTSPLKLFEYMAAGRPIVASHLPPLDEVLRHGENAWLAALGDAGALAAGVQSVLDDGELAARLAARARGDAGRFTWDARARSVIDFVERLP